MDTVLWLCPSLPTETLKWLSLLPILMQESVWWWQCSAKYIISLFPHLHTSFPTFSPSLINLMVSVDAKHHVYLLSDTDTHTLTIARLPWRMGFWKHHTVFSKNQFDICSHHHFWKMWMWSNLMYCKQLSSHTLLLVEEDFFLSKCIDVHTRNIALAENTHTHTHKKNANQFLNRKTNLWLALLLS